MPNGDNPDRFVLPAIEKPIGLNKDFSVGKIEKLRYSPSRLGELFESLQFSVCSLLKPRSSGGLVPAYVSDGV